MSKFDTSTLGELVLDTKDGDWGQDSPGDGYTPYRVIRGADFPHVRYGDISTAPLRYLAIQTVGRRTLQAGDIIIETAGGSKGRSTGRTLYVSDSLLARINSPVTCASFARFLRIDKRKADPRFIYWYLQNLHASGAMWEHQVQHTGVARFQYTRFAATHAIPLPARRVQEAIADALSAFDDKIAVNDRIAETAHGLAQAYSSRGHESAELTKLSEIADITMGSSPPGESYNEDGVGMPFYQGTRDFGDRFPDHRVWCTSPVRTAPEGSCLLSVRAPVGRVNIAREPCCIGRGVAAVQSRQDTPSVLFHELAAASDLWLPFESEGTVFGAINKRQLSGIELPVLAARSARALEEILRPLDQRVASAYDENRALASLRDALLPKLMSGEIRVRDAEKVVEDVT